MLHVSTTALVAEAQTQTDIALSAIDPTNEGSYEVATFLLRIVDAILKPLGLSGYETVETVVYAAVVFLVSIAVGYVAKWIILGAMRKFGARIAGDLYGFLREEDFFDKLCRMIPALVFLLLIQFTLVTTKGELARWLTKFTLLYVIYVTGLAFVALVGGIWRHIDSRKNKKRLPLNGLVQLLKGVVWIVALIVAVAVLADKSPGSLLAGLGAFAAVLMLVFKDSILGVVAGVQLSENDSLHVGDWIKINGTDANGTVQEVSLTSVKILNWDKTTTCVPPYSLVSGSFTNFRSM